MHGGQKLTACKLCWLEKQKKLDFGTGGCQLSFKIGLSVEGEC